MRMKTGFAFLFSAAVLAGAVLCAVVIVRRGASGSHGAPVSVPSLPATALTSVRPVAPSALHARPAASERPSAAPATKSVAAVTDAGSESLDARLAALSALGRELAVSDADALLAFLGRRDDRDALPPEKLNALKNDVANLLRAQKTFPGKLPAVLAAMWRDSTQDAVWRDYCIQHAGASWGRIADPADRENIRKLLWDAASDAALPGSGTALIALRNLVASGAEDRAKVAGRAAASAASDAAPEGVRVTALQVAAELGDPNAAVLARTFLSDRSLPVHLRMSAAAALGTAGDASDLPAMDALMRGAEPRLRAAASAAAARLRSARPR